MELIALTDNYLSARRSLKLNQNQKLRAIEHHAVSQSGLRCLTRIAQRSDVEIERPRIGGDPLRGISETSKLPEDSNLHIQELVKSFADRLILETAIHHQSGLDPAHSLGLLTSDQGLARAAMAEGVTPFFFQIDSNRVALGTTLLGTRFSPLPTPHGADRLYSVPLADLLWELAVSFGEVRLSDASSRTFIEIAAIGKELPWQPFHSSNDLLWTQTSSGTASLDLPVSAIPSATEQAPKAKGRQRAREARGQTPLKGSYRFAPSAMTTLIDRAPAFQRLADSVGMGLIGVTNRQGYTDYRNFLISGGFAVDQEDGLVPLPPLGELRAALRDGNTETSERLFRRIPSFSALLDDLWTHNGLKPAEVTSVRPAATAAYVPIADALAAVLVIPDDESGLGRRNSQTERRIYATPARPSPAEFAAAALSAYKELRKGGDFIPTGAWLERLAMMGIHPLRSRRLLEDARKANFIQRSVEGSTPDTRHGRHITHAFEVSEGNLTISELPLYDGLFLGTERASVTLRLGPG